jgi:diguanylate cyclase (GGDEF)-like protein
VLRSIAILLRDVAGPGDRVYRTGGEEFAVLCPHPHAVARLLGENIRHAVKAANVTKLSELTISAGIATLSISTPGLSELFAVADQRLYHAKASGRDRIVGEPSAAEPAAQPPLSAGNGH